MSWRNKYREEVAIRDGDFEVDELSEEEIAEIQRRCDEMDAIPDPPFDPRPSVDGRWFVAYEWHGSVVMKSESSLSRARHVIRGALHYGAKWSYLRRNKKHAMARCLLWSFDKRRSAR